MNRKEIIKKRLPFIIVKAIAAIAGAVLTPVCIIHMLLNFWELSVILPANAFFGFVAEHYFAVLTAIGIILAVVPVIGIIIELCGKCASAKYKAICAICFAVNLISLAVSCAAILQVSSALGSLSDWFDDFG